MTTNATIQQHGLLDARVTHLFHMTHLRNLTSILEHGLMSHNEAHRKGLVMKDISEPTVNDRRAYRFPDAEHSVHDYAPLYFNPLNPMQFCRRELGNDLVILAYSTEILNHTGVYVSNGNAASQWTEFYHAKEACRLNFNAIFTRFWNEIPDGKRIVCSEVLYPAPLSSSHIQRIYVKGNDSLLRAYPLIPYRFRHLLSASGKVFFS